MILPGVDDADTLEHLSTLCGTLTHDETKIPVISPESIRMLPDTRALIILVNRHPVDGQIPHPLAPPQLPPRPAPQGPAAVRARRARHPRTAGGTHGCRSLTSPTPKPSPGS